METSCSSISTSMSSTGGSIKLTINSNDEFRRIAINRLLKDKNDLESISFETLKNYAISYSGLKLKSKDDDGIAVMKATYCDEDGDRIEISTDEELADAIMLQDELKNSNNRVSSVLIINVSVQVEASSTVKETEEKATLTTQTATTSQTEEKQDSVSQNEEKPDSASQTEEEASASHTQEKATIPAVDSETQENESRPSKARTSRRPQRQRRHCRNRRNKHQKNVLPVKAAVDTVIDFVNDTVDTITAGLNPYPASTHYTQTVFDPNHVHARHTCDGCSLSPIVGYRYHAVNIPDFDLCLACKTKCVLSDINFIQTQDGTMTKLPDPQYEGVDPNFVHSRHTCDACAISPIVGYRWHSTNIANYDLCDGCKPKNICTDITFKLQQIESDRAYPRSNPILSPMKPCSDEEESSSPGLQRALQMSCLESKCTEQDSDADDNNAIAAETKSSSLPNIEPLGLSASEVFEYLVPTANKVDDEDMKKLPPQLVETDSVSEAGTQTDFALRSSTESNSPSIEEREIIKEGKNDDSEDSEDVESTSDNVVAEKLSDEQEKDNISEDDEWAMIEDETVHEAIGSSLFRQGLSSS